MRGPPRHAVMYSFGWKRRERLNPGSTSKFGICHMHGRPQLFWKGMGDTKKARGAGGRRHPGEGAGGGHPSRPAMG